MLCYLSEQADPGCEGIIYTHYPSLHLLRDRVVWGSVAHTAEEILSLVDYPQHEACQAALHAAPHGIYSITARLIRVQCEGERACARLIVIQGKRERACARPIVIQRERERGWARIIVIQRERERACDILHAKLASHHTSLPVVGT